MAYDPSNLSALFYANGFTGWHYRTHDTWPDCLDTGYFEPAANMLRLGETITMQCADVALIAFVVGHNPLRITAATGPARLFGDQ